MTRLRMPPGWTPTAWRVLVVALSKAPSQRTVGESRAVYYFLDRRPWIPCEQLWHAVDEASEPNDELKNSQAAKPAPDISMVSKLSN